MKLYDLINELLEKDPYYLSKSEKDRQILHLLKKLIGYHRRNCEKYNIWYKRNSFKEPSQIHDLSEIPFLPSSVFKHIDLRSVSDKVKIIKSSGTSSKLRSSIFIDSKTSQFQTKALTKILVSILGKRRRPFFIVDCKPVKAGGKNGTLSARFAGISGYLMAASSRDYLLSQDENGNLFLNDNKVQKMIKYSRKGPIVIIGYTYMLWQYLLNKKNVTQFEMSSYKKNRLIHFGGWKKLAEKKISKNILNKHIKNQLNIDEEFIFDIYGFTEQLGTVYVSSGDKGCRVSSYSNVLVRDVNTLKVVPDGDIGLLQFLSPIQLSYPGFSILNDDLGTINNRYTDSMGHEIIEFDISKRLLKAENRGCGDTLPDNYYI
tara:strand:- start:2480 stop:3601 length:1122 start_codon:yes stop_codon:yes gene_type:complete